MDSLIRLAVTAGVVLIYRWSLHLSTPQQDYAQLCDYGSALLVYVRRGMAMLRVWLISLTAYVPSSHVERAWLDLRERFAAGRYGPAGT